MKGSSIALALDLVRERHGDDGVEQIRARLSAATIGALPEDLRPLASHAYPLYAWADVLLTADALFGSPRSIVRESGRLGYVKLLRTIYRNWVRELDPRGSIANMPLLWEQVTSGLGTLEVDASDTPIVVTVRLTVSPRIRGITEQRVAGTIDAILEVCESSADIEIFSHPDRTEYHVRLR